MGMFGVDKVAQAERTAALRKNVTMTEHSEDLTTLLVKLETDLVNGLSTATAAAHVEQFGRNELTPPKTTPWYVKFFHEMTGFFSLLLWGAGIACFVSYGLVPDNENLYLGVVLFAVVFLTGCFSYLQNRKSDNMMAEFKAMRPPKVKVVRDGQTMLVDSAVITIGDVVLLEQGDLVPADCRIVECSPNMCVDNASLTGESEAVKRKPECTHDEVLETANLAFFGTQVPEGSARTIVVKIGDETLIGRIASLALSTESDQTPINKEIEHFIFIISGIAISLGVTFFAVMLASDSDPILALVFMIGIIVANVPEGLLATVTVCLTLTAKRMFTKKVMVKNLEGVETLGSTSCICSDKTGTLTQNIMTVAQIVYADAGNVLQIEDTASAFTKGIRTYDPDSKAFHSLLRCSVLCNTCYFEKYFEDEDTGKRVLLPFKKTRTQGDGSSLEVICWQPIGNASEGAMIKFAHPAVNESLGVKDIEDLRKINAKVFDIPFNSKNKYQVHVHCDSGDAASNGNDRVVYMKGAPERVLCRCAQYLGGDGEVYDITDTVRAEIEAKQEHMGSNGLRVLGFAMKTLPIADYPADYFYTDGREEGFSTANFPLGEYEIIKAYADAKAAGEELKDEKGKVVDPPHPLSGEPLIFLGMMALIDPPREAVPGAVAKCKTAGIKVIMVTGDHPGTAKAIAYKVGILWSPTKDDLIRSNAENRLSPGDAGYQDPDSAQAIVCPGWEFSDDMGDDKWDAILEHPQIVFARTSPQQKLVIVGNCQRLGHIVAVTGDGVNDSPALKKADIGIAMGIAGTPVTKNAADMILLDDNFASIVAGVEEGRLIFDNLKKSICYTLTSNIPEISPFLCWILFKTPLPLNTVLILAIDLGTDMVPAISMAYEEAEADIMKRPPRNAKVDRLVTRKLIFLAYLQIGIMQAMAGFYAWMVVLNDYGYPPTVLLGNPDYGENTMYCRYQGGQYVNGEGEIDFSRDPEVDAPSSDFPMWDRGQAGYLKKCTFPLKMMKGGKNVPGGSFEFREAQTYDPKKTNNEQQVSAESIWALESQGFFSYVPWRARISPFWNRKWLSWDITRNENRGGFATLGFKGQLDGQFIFLRQPVGVWSSCLFYDQDLGGHKTDSDEQYLPAQAELGDGFDLTDKVWKNGLTTQEQYPFPNGPCAGKTNGKKVFRSGTFCNGGYLTNGTASGGPGCETLDTMTSNLRYCRGGCGCTTADEVPAGPGRNDADVFQCLNIASRMTQAAALQHGRAAYWVSIVVVQWADLLICKTRWLSMRQQGLRNSVLNFGLFFETLLAAWLCYGGQAIQSGLGTQPLRFTHWMPGIPWCVKSGAPL